MSAVKTPTMSQTQFFPGLRYGLPKLHRVILDSTPMIMEPQKGCGVFITHHLWGLVIECLHLARIRAGLPHIPAEDVSKGFNKRLWILSA
jgi:hypothetical protein